jgi:hypothetical protein
MEDVEDLPARSLREMSRSILLVVVFYFVVAIAFVAIPKVASADDPPDPDRLPTKSASLVTPSAGVAVGRWIGLPVQRLSLGFESSTSRSAKTGPALVISGFLEPGRSDNGLGAHRAELGLSISTAPQTFRAALGGHISYAMIERATTNDSFTRALLLGDIGAFGIGIHSNLGLAFPFSRGRKNDVSPSFRIGVRGSIDLYDGGFGFQGGPMLGVEL